MTPFDQWDYDGITREHAGRPEVDGKKRKVLIHFRPHGFAYVLDRTRRHAAARQQVRSLPLGEKID